MDLEMSSKQYTIRTTLRDYIDYHYPWDVAHNAMVGHQNSKIVYVLGSIKTKDMNDMSLYRK